jgi:cell division septal protein FtsQ
MSRLRPVGAFIWAVASVGLGAGLYSACRAAPGLNPFVLKVIRIEGASRTSRADVLRGSGLRPGMGLFDVDMAEVRQAVERLPWVRAARVARHIPSTVQIALQEWEPRCLIRIDRLYYLTREGHVVQAPLDQGLDYAVVTGLTWADIEGETRLAKGLVELLGVIDRGLLRDEVSEIAADPSLGFTLYTPAGGGTALRAGFSGFEERLRRLARLRRHLERRGQAAYAVDLSHDDKIIARLLPAAGKGARP